MTNIETLTNNHAILKKIGLLGHPISHSKSPALFKAAYPNTPFTYELIEADTLQKGMACFSKENFIGANITAPYKDDIFQYITHPDRISSLLKSANIILHKSPGEIHSYNSDYYGVKETVSQLMTGDIARKERWNSVQEKISTSFQQEENKIALVIGAGGAGKAAALALADLGISVFIANRTPEKAEQFSEILRCEQKQNTLVSSANTAPIFTGISLSQIPEYLEKCTLIIHALSFQIQELTTSSLQRKIVFEANYGHPCLAPKTSISAEYGYISGKYWLYNQAIPAFKLFTGTEPDTQKMWDVF